MARSYEKPRIPTQNKRLADQGGGHIHPPLVGEQVAGDIDPAMREAPIRPPFEQPMRIGIGARGKKAEIVDPGFHDGMVGRLLAIL